MFAAWLVSPWLFAGGTLLVSAPIIIHLLNKRKFKTVDWAAMDFLVEADKRNRRRIRLEDLLLLVLRCLAVVLIALLVARSRRFLAGAAYTWTMRILGAMLILFALILVRDGLVLSGLARGVTSQHSTFTGH